MRGYLLLSASVAVLAMSGASYGQEGVSSSGGAETSDQGYAGIQDIVVTAQKRSQNVQDVPIAISTFTAGSLQERAVGSVASLSNVTPNVTLDAGSPYAGSNSVLAAYIRGIGQNDFAANLDPGVGVYLDGIYLARTVGANFDLPDVERIEVLKGPQGTLFGRNTIGGAISIVTRDPGKTFAFRGDITTGRYNRLDVNASVDLPITDTLSVPCNFILSFRVHEAGDATTGPSNGKLLLDTFSSQAVTPRDESNVDYYFSWGTSEETYFPGIVDLMFETNAKAFEEDKRMLEGQWERMQQYPGAPEINIVHDAGPSRILWILDKLLEEENAEQPAMEVA